MEVIGAKAHYIHKVGNLRPATRRFVKYSKWAVYYLRQGGCYGVCLSL